MTKANIRQLQPKELEAVLIENGQPAFRSRQIWEWLWKKHARDFSEMTNLPVALRQQLNDKFSIRSLSFNVRSVSNDGTAKGGFTLEEGELTEGVLIPDNDRITACISTQAGCPLNCAFCATGHLGFFRDLDAGEIFDQFYELNSWAVELYGKTISNVVLMGMGEPLLNFNETERFIRILSSAEGLEFSQRRITLSTAGIPDGIRKLADSGLQVTLALSLHSAIQEKREKLMPVAKKHDLKVLMDALIYYHRKTGNRITIEYLMLGGVTDSMEDLKELIRFCSHFATYINLIPYNPVPGLPFEPAEEKVLALFLQTLRGKRFIANSRKSRGQDIQAACGQLANELRNNDQKINK